MHPLCRYIIYTADNGYSVGQRKHNLMSWTCCIALSVALLDRRTTGKTTGYEEDVSSRNLYYIRMAAEQLLSDPRAFRCTRAWHPGG